MLDFFSRRHVALGVVDDLDPVGRGGNAVGVEGVAQQTLLGGRQRWRQLAGHLREGQPTRALPRPDAGDRARHPLHDARSVRLHDLSDAFTTPHDGLRRG